MRDACASLVSIVNVVLDDTTEGSQEGDSFDQP